jgi:cell division protein DivIC
MLNSIKKNYFLLIMTVLFFYLLLNLLGGDRGLFSNLKKKQILISLQNVEVDLSDKIKDLEFKNSLLSDQLDLDYVETLIRKKFLFGKEGETLYILNK